MKKLALLLGLSWGVIAQTFPINSTIWLKATSTDPGCTTTAHIGKTWFDNTTTTTAYKVCVAISATPGWMTVGTGGGTPGGLDTAVQFNDTLAFGGDATNFYYNKTTHVLTATGGYASGTGAFVGTGAVGAMGTICSGTPASGNFCFGVDSTGKNFQVKDDTAAISGTVYPNSGASHHFLTAISVNGVVSDAAIAASDLPASNLPTPGTTVDLTGAKHGYCIVSGGAGTCTPPTPAAGYEYCARNGNNQTNVITLAAVTNVYYEKTDRSGYGTVSYKLVSGGAATDQICILGLDATHYLVMNSTGTWTDTAP
jgi:hypothetical protein